MENKETIEVEPIEVKDVPEEIIEQLNPTLEKGNYVIEVISEGQVIKKLAVANSEINITKLAEGGMTVDLK